MSSTRDVISPGVFADNASTTIPPTPIAGQSYRDPVAGPASVPDGWPYADKVNSAEFNQLMFQYSTLLSIMDKQGILGWCNLVEYAIPAIVFGSNGKIYTAIQASGPSTAAKDPISEPTYWKEFLTPVQATETVAGIAEIATPSESAAGAAADKIITPVGVRYALNATGTAPVYACRAWVNFNGTGATISIRGSGNVSSIADGGVGVYTINFTTAMPDANYCAVSMSGAGGSANATLGGRLITSQDLVYAAGSLRVYCTDASDATAQDTEYANVSIFR